MTPSAPYSRAVLDYLAGCTEPVTPREVGIATGSSTDSARKTLKRLERLGLAEHRRPPGSVPGTPRPWLWLAVDPRVVDAPVPLHLRAVRSLPALAGVVAAWARAA